MGQIKTPSKEELRLFTLNLSQIKGIGSLVFQKLYKKYGTITKLYTAYLYQQISLINKDQKTKELLNDGLQNQLNKLKINYKCFWEDDYPFHLKEITDPPIVIYYKGSWIADDFKQTISVVGTRTPTSYGKKIANLFSSQLSSIGFTIVSGMAMGIDKEAHKGVLEVNGLTVAVLAGSVDCPTPSTNKDIYHRILDKNGIIMSEFPPGTNIVPGMFAKRNRIIAGLSQGSLIIEAGIKSGALITARLAGEYNRDVFAIPGNIDSKSSEGTNALLKENKAILVQNINDIMSEFSYNDQSFKEIQLEKIKTDLEPNQKKIYDILESGPKHINDLINYLKIEVSKIASCCTELEIKGLISRNSRGQYFICTN